ncbi:16S rRNA (adenine(1518)-N(6)/adenine(1519)-N(6))-dimethyltransferase RsmA [Desulforamulus hydrothermalis]|uniref:Ribosomal RNA small subunit methyltransferase A n=1 Tax=Desulforamulus hydrothermalis Lam5 = DSM 18033 TaxID=1121428 RepID=K8DZN2_9FIRM|nr:16S rRNA (adenine(1518)-N(6)/adenine(1519)-N(6))-dimethyltransferase RsmA [Desulforamulus hydrothermalis]CCO08579.1 Ribosomal RNA small subunit methyltransferase A [Desulforamulus hydrothermalis Lam5 = DSM 18033]SHH01797.1 dimethyladenosine transferase [Desulforamulus hydrothermalis Lam5 = DSM 18033]
MRELTSPSAVREIIRAHGFKVRKALGQNFLLDANIIEKIVQAAELSREDLVFEIGPGLGTLTRRLARSAGQVIAVELDTNLLPILAETLADFPNTRVVHGDALQADFDKLAGEYAGGIFGQPGRGYKLVANLPYYITTPLLMHLLTGGFNLQCLVVMMQKEVADRLLAPPGGKDYGSLSVAVQYYTVPEVVARVPKTVFFPAPEVDSAVVRLTRRAVPPVQVTSEALFFKVVRAAFGQRRKTLLNSLTGSGLAARENWLQVLAAAGIDPARRGETLTMQEFAALANAFQQHLGA